MKKLFAVITLIAMVSMLSACDGEKIEGPINTAIESEVISETEKIEPTEDISSEVEPSFKQAVDDFEEFIDEYCAFIGKYKDAEPGEQFEMMKDYAELGEKYTEMYAQMQGLDTAKMTADDLAYYLDVMERCMEKVRAVTE